MFKLDLEKKEELEIKLPTPIGSEKKQRNSQKISSKKNSTSASLTIYDKAFYREDHNNL